MKGPMNFWQCYHLQTSYYNMENSMSTHKSKLSLPNTNMIVMTNHFQRIHYF